MRGSKAAVVAIAVAIASSGCTTIVRGSVASNGVAAEAASNPLGARSISDSGRYVVFVSHAANLVANDTNDRMDVFRHDNKTGTTVRVSVAGNGAQNPMNSVTPVISGNGDHVAFVTARKLEPADTNNEDDVYVRSVSAGTTERVSIRPDGMPVIGKDIPSGFGDLSISRDGRFVTMVNSGSGSGEIFIRDRATETTIFPNNGTAASRAMISSDGTQVVWNLSCTGGPCPGLSVVQSVSGGGTHEPIDVSCGFTPLDVGEDARFVVGIRFAIFPRFECPEPTGLVRWDRSDRSFLKVPIEGFYEPSISISDNGRYVAGIDQNAGAVRVVDMNSGHVGVADTDGLGRKLPEAPSGAALSGSGRYVAFTTAAKLVPEDTNTLTDVFTRYSLQPTVVSAAPTSVVRSETHVAVSIHGIELLSGLSVSVSGTGITIHSVTYESTTVATLDVSVDSHAPIGPRDVLVSNRGGFGHSDALCAGCLTVT
jgi:hypothetical protein